MIILSGQNETRPEIILLVITKGGKKTWRLDGHQLEFKKG